MEHAGLGAAERPSTSATRDTGRTPWALLGRVLLFALPFLMLLGGPAAVLLAAGELMPVRSVVEHQREHSVLYGPAYTNPDRAYKTTAVRLRAPRLVALGSSRVLQLRAEMFAPSARGSYYNAGRAAGVVWELRPFLAQAPPTLRTIVLGIDHWWFNPAWSRAAGRTGAGPVPDEPGPATLVHQHWIEVYRGIRSGKINLRRVLASPAVGLSGIMHDDGFRSDGSYQYGLTLCERPTPAAAFAESFQRIAEGTERFEAGDALDEEALAELERFLDDAKARGIHVVAFTPPLAPAVLARMRKTGRYPYLQRLSTRLDALLGARRVPFQDLTDCSTIGCRDEQFLDGFHASERVYATLLGALATRDPALAAQVDPALPAALARSSDPLRVVSDGIRCR